MNKGIVIAVDPARSLFAVQTEEGLCAVFCQHAGSPVAAGDILEGPVKSKGDLALGHADGTCSAIGGSGPISREEALARLGAA